MYALGVSADQLPVVKAAAVIIICLIQSKKAQEMFDKWKASRHSQQKNDTKAVIGKAVKQL
jgi:simple sugar transport system permease protein